MSIAEAINLVKVSITDRHGETNVHYIVTPLKVFATTDELGYSTTVRDFVGTVLNTPYGGRIEITHV
jgi:hypothetical protein